MLLMRGEVRGERFSVQWRICGWMVGWRGAMLVGDGVGEVLKECGGEDLGVYHSKACFVWGISIST